MTGIEESMVKLALAIALCGLIPAGAALASERAREAAGGQRLAGTIGEIRGERLVLVTEQGGRVTVDAERCAAAATVGEKVEFTGHPERDGEFEARSMTRPGGAVLACDDDRRDDRHRLAAAAPVDAAAAIEAARRAGYPRVTDLEWERGAWKLRTADADGRAARLMVDGWTGQLSTRQR
ncbi:PepSY domain-containing protein [Siccirubricoccus sp. G192]|uniref:PepSY domain-containing protein n=1 Tax=Siccirubricoccus sp. G192 TaxID=2849651 RepID=UPI001C2BF067|nr:PepSY domain-containing protein [Siccirubricoccus sp. G192]MBV1799926.1 PepSY domain-containing protein [Siccirubricoccus sp. G192]